MNIFQYAGPGVPEQVREGLEALGLKTTGVRLSSSSTDETPEVVVDLSSGFDDDYAIVEAYAREHGGGLLHCIDHRHHSFEYAEAQFNFPGAKSLVLLHVEGRAIGVLRHHDRPFGGGKK